MDSLSPKELDVLGLLAEGYDNQKIADELNCGISTIAGDLNRIYSKLEVNGEFDERNKRVAAARIFLRDTGRLSEEKGDK